MNEFKLNFKNRYQENDLQCKLGCLHLDDQDYFLKCDVINEQSQRQIDNACYYNIFSRNVTRVKQAVEVLSTAMDIRLNLLNPITPDNEAPRLFCDSDIIIYIY